MTSIRIAQKQLTRDRLLESALRLFQERGYDATKIDAIAVGAGATRTTFYLHFASKTELVEALIEQISGRIISSDVPRLEDVVAGGRKEDLAGWVNRRFDQWPIIMPYVQASEQAAATEPEIKLLVHNWHESAVAEIVAGLSTAGRFAEEDRRTRAVLAFAQVEYVSKWWLNQGWSEDVSRARMHATMTDTLYRILVLDAMESVGT